MPTHSHKESDILNRVERAFRITKRNTRHSLPLTIGDDAALFRPTASCETILTCDWFLEGSHFLRDKHPADAVGWKCLARAISDIAAMGGVPRCFLMSLALPQSHTGRWLDQFLAGLKRASRTFACPLAGGDTTKREEILINITVVGEIRNGKAIRRSGARPGDIIFVSGRLGEAEAGLGKLRSSKGLVNSKDPGLRKHLFPEPRLALGAWIAKNKIATAMMDLSDGLSSDLPRLCSASGVGARIDAVRIPSVRLPDAETKSGLDPLQLALHGGDDYELLFTVPRSKAKSLRSSYEGVPLSPIGEITKGHKLLLIDRNGQEQSLEPGGWDPFRVHPKKSRAN